MTFLIIYAHQGENTLRQLLIHLQYVQDSTTAVGWTFWVKNRCNMLIFLYLQRLSLIWLKKMLFCGSSDVVRNGVRGRTQRYKCKARGRRFDGGVRRDKTQVITDYVEGKLTLQQLASKYGVKRKDDPP